MDIEKLADSLFASDDIKPRDELNLAIFHQLFYSGKTSKLADVREMLSQVSIAQLEDLYSEVNETDSTSDEGESYCSLGERVLFHIGEIDNTYFNRNCWRILKSQTKKKFI